ncbi:ribosomal protein L2 [Atractiella rhizophila]|nr:ribosomal protein L2 [Atractiella rhizophila]
MKTWKPITPSIRHQKRVYNPHLWQGEPLRALTIPKKSTGGRNNTGKNVTRGRGGGHKRRIRLVDFFRREGGVQEVLRIEYDPGRTAHIALLKHTETNQLSYILAPVGLREGDKVQSFRDGLPEEFLAEEERERMRLERGEQDTNLSLEAEAEEAELGWMTTPETNEEAQALRDAKERLGIDIDVPSIDSDIITPPTTTTTATSTSSTTPIPSQKEKEKKRKSTRVPLLDLGALRTHALHPGNVLPLKYIPLGTRIHAICLHARGKASLARSAGAYAETVSGGEGEYVHVRLSSGEVRKVKGDCCATIGEVSNPDHRYEVLGKAGRARWMGRRPKVRGVAMNRVDHPLGGGRGKSKSNKHPQSANGILKFTRTRKPGGKRGNQLVVQARPRGKERRGRK